MNNGALVSMKEKMPLVEVMMFVNVTQFSGGTMLVVQRTLNWSLVGADQVSVKLPFVEMLLLIGTGFPTALPVVLTPVRINR